MEARALRGHRGGVALGNILGTPTIPSQCCRLRDATQTGAVDTGVAINSVLAHYCNSVLGCGNCILLPDTAIAVLSAYAAAVPIPSSRTRTMVAPLPAASIAVPIG